MVSVDRLVRSSLTPLHWLAVGLAIGTGLIHLILGLEFVPNPLGISFVLAAGGFFGAVVLVLVDYRRRLVILLGIPYTGVQILLWYALNRPRGVEDLTIVGAIDKVIQGVLIVTLIVLVFRES